MLPKSCLSHPAAVVEPVGMWVSRQAYPSYPRAARRRRLPPAFDRRGTNGAARCCTTRRLNAHITSEQRVLYDWHPWAGRIVTVHSVLDKASDSVARCSLAREATGLPLEVPLWMFDRMMCSSARREHHPQVCQRRSKISPPGRSKTSPLDVMRYAVLGGCPGSP